MTTIQLQFLEAMRQAVRGKHVDWPQITPEDWQELLQLSEAQRMLPMLVEAAYPSAAFRTLPEEVKWQARKQARQQVFDQTRKEKTMFALLAAFEKANVPVLVVKGAVCRRLYPLPEARLSSDEDLLVAPEYFDTAVDLLRELGYQSTVEEFAPDAHEVTFVSQDGLHVELHRRLFSGEIALLETANAYFDGVHAEGMQIRTRGGMLPAMGAHAHMLFLLCHAFKHLIYRGIGLRQMCDIVLWGEKYADEIDWKKLEEQCVALRAWGFARTVFAVGQTHLGIPLPVDCSGMEEQMDALLEDAFAGGVFGGESLSRKHSAEMTRGAVEQEKRKKIPAMFSALFPKKKNLEGRYHWLEKYPFLLPVAWGDRLAGYAAERKGVENDPMDSIRIGKERIELLRTLNVIE